MHVHPACCVAAPAVILLDVTAPASANGGGNGSSNGGGGGGMVFAEARLERFLGGERGLGEGQLLVALHLPLPQPGDYFWCHKVPHQLGRCLAAVWSAPEP